MAQQASYNVFRLVREGVAAGRITELQSVTHRFFHIEEAVAIFGTERFAGLKGFNAAKTQYWGTGWRTIDHRPAIEHIREGTIMFGTGGLHPLNEHAGEGYTSTANDSCVMRTAMQLGVRHMPAFSPIIEAAHVHDTSGGGSTFELHNILKMMHYTSSDEECMVWVQTAIKARFEANVKAASKAGIVSKPGNMVIETPADKPAVMVRKSDEAFGLWILDKLALSDIPDPTSKGLLSRVLKAHRAKLSPDMLFLANRVQSGEKQYKPSHLHLDSILEAMCILGWDWTAVSNWVYTAFEAILADVRAYRQAKVELEQPGVRTQADIKVRGRTLHVQILQSDHHKIVTAAGRSPTTAVTLRLKKDGHMQVFLNKDLLTRIFPQEELKDRAVFILRQCRRKEGLRKGVEIVDPILLSAEGGIDQLPEWFFHLALLAIFNGSDTAPDVPATGLSLDEVVEIIRQAFSIQDPTRCFKTCSECHQEFSFRMRRELPPLCDRCHAKAKSAVKAKSEEKSSSAANGPPA